MKRSLHVYLEQSLRAADFLQYEDTEEQLVDRVVMNFHPSILGQVAFLDRPLSLKYISCCRLDKGQILWRKIGSVVKRVFSRLVTVQ